MTWTWGAAPSTATSAGRRDALRSLIRDTDSSRQLLTDEELAFFYAQEGNLYRAAASACWALADGQKVNKTVGDLSISQGSVLQNYRTLAQLYRMRADNDASVYAGGISQSDKLMQEQDSDRVVPSFTRSLHVDPERSTGSRSST